MTAKFVDIDGHIMEPANLWLDYIEPEYREHALRISEDEDGLEYLNVDGKKSYFGRGGSLGALGAIGQDVRPYLSRAGSRGRRRWSREGTSPANG